ncbi:hypothetical protein QBC45DRAFT_412268 [Copromyces sp. CBS 386.78]|nr:hypothetical protein QBC45DRAFT_412268 [Copromyces sp. CBS 386.78]
MYFRSNQRLRLVFVYLTLLANPILHGNTVTATVKREWRCVQRIFCQKRISFLGGCLATGKATATSWQTSQL